MASKPATLSTLNPFKPEFTIVIFIQAANCCRNSRLVVNEDDLKLVENGKNTLLLLKQLHENFRSESSMCRKLKYSSGMQHDALMHREGLKG